MNYKWIRDYSDFFYLGLMFPSSIAVGVGFGYLGDHFLHTDPWCKIAGFFLGVGAGFYNFVRDYRRIVAKKNESRKD